MNLREFIQSLDMTQIALAVVGGFGSAWLWAKRKYLYFGRWRRAVEARRVALDELPSRVSGFHELLKGMQQQMQHVLDALTDHTKTLSDQNKALDNLTAMIHGEMELDPIPRFICDSSGKNINVNTAYARLLGCGRDELMGFGYKRFLTEELNPGYVASFNGAAAQHRSFEGDISVLKPDGTLLKARVRVVPHPESSPPAQYWVGVVTPKRRASDA